MISDSPPPFDAIVFDCDSTLSAIEGIDELARSAEPERLAQVERLTDEAMAGEVALEDVYARRLEILQPTRSAVLAIGQRYVETLTPNARALCAALASLEKPVYVVSGGLLPAVEHVARDLALSPSRVHAVPIHFDDAGAYAGFDVECPLARGGGKIDVIGKIAERHGRVAHVGDGTTDLEAHPVLARFVGFGGVVDRAAVREQSARFVSANDFAALATELLAPGELAKLASDAPHADFARAVREFV